MSGVLAAARSRWADLTGEDVAFPDDGVRVVVAPSSRLCPPGWLGVVTLGGATLVSAPDAATAARAEPLRALTPDARTDADAVGRLLPVDAVLGPARLAYLGDGALASADGPAPEAVPAGDAALGAMLAAHPEDADESGLDGGTSPVFVVRDGDRVVAAASYGLWPSGTAHLGVLVAPEHRGRGLARVVGRAASAAALEAGLLPQWRARAPASIRTAASLGYEDLGAQLSVRLGA